jgi:FADH2 O2-dependent halogenase
MNGQKIYDTIILGAGIAGSSLAAVLAKNGHSVLMIEKGRHPRFAIGEASFFRACMWMWMTGKRYDVPELVDLADLDQINLKAAPSSGWKLTYAQTYHQAGEAMDEGQMHKIIPPIVHFVKESHFYRQDVDLYMLNAALRYGAEYLDMTTVNEVDIREDGVSVRTDDGEYQGRFIVDGAGFNAPVAQTLGLRDETPRAKTHSRAIFTHMADVQPFDNLLEQDHPGSYSYHEGTLHHAFDGGWFWIIPFDNVEGSDSNLCSVGLLLDSERHPRPEDIGAEDEFWEWVNRFPGVARHLTGARPTRPFVATGRLQYSSSQAAGARFALLSMATGFIDPLYSRGLIWSFETVYALAHRLMEAIEQDDFTAERFEYLNGMSKAQLKRNDQLVHNAYRSMKSFETWNAWTRVFIAGELTNALYLWRRCLWHIKTGDKRWLEGLDESPKPTFEAPHALEMQALIDDAEALFDRMEMGELEPSQAADLLFEIVASADILPTPAYDFGDPEATSADFTTPQALAKVLAWGKLMAPEAIRDDTFKLPMGTIAKLELGGKLKPVIKKLRRERSRPAPAPAVG